MAERRMFSKKITESDAFLDMPVSSQNLYFHLSMNADDDGFVDKVKSIMRMTGNKDDDLKILYAKSFIIPFESGVIVIKHWRMNNYLRSDRHNQTSYIDEFNQLTIKENGAYTLKEDSGTPLVYQSVTENSIVENSIGKNSIIYSANAQCVFDFWNSCNIIVHRELTEKLNKVIEKALNIYSLDTIKECISRYNQIINDKTYFFDYKWTLSDFLTRKDGISSFTDEGSKWNSYLEYRNKLTYSKPNKIKEDTNNGDGEDDWLAQMFGNN